MIPAGRATAKKLWRRLHGAATKTTMLAYHPVLHRYRYACMFNHLPSVYVSQCSVEDSDRHHILWRSFTNSHQNSNPPPRPAHQFTRYALCVFASLPQQCYGSTVILHALCVYIYILCIAPRQYK